MEGQVGNGVDILPLHQLGLFVEVGGLLGVQFGLVPFVAAGIAVQHLNGAGIVIDCGLGFRLRKQALEELGRLVCLLAGGNGGLLVLFVLDLLVLKSVGQRTGYKGDHQQHRHTGDDHRQIGFLEDLHFGGALSSSAAAVLPDKVRLRILPAVDGLHIPAEELGEQAGLLGLFGLFRLLLLGGQFDFRQLQPLPVLPGAGLLHRPGAVVLTVGCILGRVIFLRVLLLGVILLPFLRLPVFPSGEIQVLPKVVTLGIVPLILGGTIILGVGVKPVLLGKLLLIQVVIFIVLRSQLLVVQLKILKILLGLLGLGLLFPAQIIIVKLGQIKLTGVVTIQKLFGVKPHVFFKIEIHVEIILIHGKSLPYGIIDYILSSRVKKSKMN